ncbi:lysoplasmalogenase [Alteromonas facilis]|uniref:lysoplasmalogenase n=1 Tax=Alteromonas facilis TaxID=2048004 RepID=UPI000C2824F1|nr:lysoplasmalogenase [Alteromonas facilis]
MKWLFSLAAVLGVTYVVSLPFHPYPFSFVLKAMPVLLLAAISLRLLSGRQRVLYIIAMVGSAAGDVFLDMDRQLYLKHALLSFLITQICYIVIFVKLRAIHKLSLPAKTFSYVAPIAVAIFLLYQFHPNTGTMWWPVVVYVACLTAMAILAMQTGHSWIALGGVLFMLADAMIGINRFWLPFDASTYVIVSTYLTAQLLIGYGLLLKR